MIGLKYVFIAMGAVMYATVYFSGTNEATGESLVSPSNSRGSTRSLLAINQVEQPQRKLHTPTTAPTAVAVDLNISVPTLAPTATPTVERMDLMKHDLFTMEEKRNGAILLHIWCILVMFYGIAVLCDNYFEPALEKICEKLNLEEDVAGATFMAAGGSAPELATSLLGVFVTKSDVGIGTIVGSAVFNVLFVIGVCAIVAPNLTLTWWPLARDCTYYCISILVLTVVILDQEVTWYEAVILLGMYMIYVLIMANNQKLHRKVEWHIANHDITNRPKICQTVARFTSHNAFDFFIYAVIILNLVVTVGYPDQPIPDFINLVCALIYILEFLAKTFGLGFVGFWLDAMNALDGMLVVLIIVELMLSASEDSAGSADYGSTARSVRTARLFRFFRVIRVLRVIRLYKAFYHPKSDAYTQTTPRLEAETPEEQIGDGGDFTKMRRRSIVSASAPSGHGAKIVPATDETETPAAKPDGEGGEGEEDDDDDDGPFDPFEVPEDALGKFVWAINLPLVVMMWMVIPDCQRDDRANWYPLSFINCILTIAVLAYVMVWMATLFGKVTGIPDAVMGLTFLAAGTSIPDALSSLAVAKKGFGDMAVSSSVGSNIFDILIGLPLPWFLQTAIVDPGGTVPIKSEGIAIMIITLFIMVALVVLSISAFQWKLVQKLGYIYMGLYVIFVVESLLLEYKVF